MVGVTERARLNGSRYFNFSWFEYAASTFSGTIMATLTRKRKSMDFLPKYEMVTHYKGSSIPTSHIHMYDPDNVTISCNIFRVSRTCRYLLPT